jgi:hypothetical protein
VTQKSSLSLCSSQSFLQLLNLRIAFLSHLSNLVLRFGLKSGQRG